jgi:hypothetical protein
MIAKLLDVQSSMHAFSRRGRVCIEYKDSDAEVADIPALTMRSDFCSAVPRQRSDPDEAGRFAVENCKLSRLA